MKLPEDLIGLIKGSGKFRYKYRDVLLEASITDVQSSVQMLPGCVSITIDIKHGEAVEIVHSDSPWGFARIAQ